MTGNPQVLDLLNDVLTSELTSVNQYFLHAKMCRNWGYLRLAEIIHKESVGEMKHADDLIERILYLEGLPNLQRLYKVNVGESVPEQLRLDRTTEISFNAVLMQDIMALESRNMMIKAGAIKEKPVYLHRIEAQDMLASVGRSSKLNTDWSFLTYLHDLGQQAATDWLDKAYGQAAA